MKSKLPAVYLDSLFPLFYKLLNHCDTVLDCMAGTGKIALVKEYGYEGKVFANDIEQEWADSNYPVDYWSQGDAAHMNLFKGGAFDAIITEPTRGNRLADRFIKNSRNRTTYTQSMGRPLTPGNTGDMMWGSNYRMKHAEIYLECKRVLKPGGLMVVNIANYPRRGVVVDVVNWTKNCLVAQGLKLEEEYLQVLVFRK
jgi:SAM-dependent methyltransferase